MLWFATIGLAAALTVFELGRLTILVVLLAVALKLVLALVAVLGLAVLGIYLWRQYSNRRNSLKGLLEDKR